MTETLLRGVRALLAIIRVLSALLLVGSVGINFANIVGRYFFNTSIPWAEETMLFLMVGCVFLGTGVVAWSGRHLRMDVVVNALPPRMREALDLFSELLLIATAITIVIVRLAGRAATRGIRSTQSSGQYPARHSAGDGADRVVDYGLAGCGASDHP